ncbi:DUF72 domain-containing protein [Risungbinella massiliensis]|uniref:DUF72 domain-containing protein n=1 Tax=Risungbinella massiliensis TaxID=1329796 RepID=UPI000AF12E41|nr:DUF72 domain-containing protein [Risungbinella massiliensis]
MKNQLIQVGLSGWGDHDIYPRGTPSGEKLPFYATQYPIVELDSTYHAIAPVSRMEKWVEETPSNFRFVVKAYRELTGHGRKGQAPIRSWQQQVTEMKNSLAPMQSSNKLSMILFQFPPWYDCQKKHVQYIRKIKEAFADYPVAIEFRHMSWFSSLHQDQTLQFLEGEQLIHVVCDEPQSGTTCVPIVPVVTNPEKVLVRFHGRNLEGWNFVGQPNWRDVRYAYRYTTDELQEWVTRLEELVQRAKEVILIFNNNSQGDAADNARQMRKLLGQDLPEPAPRQLDLF